MAKYISTTEILALPPSKPEDWVVADLLRTGRKRPALLCGLPEAGKSTLAHQLALAVANGVAFLDRATVKGHVLFWKNEESASDVREDLVRAGLVDAGKLTMILPEPKDNNIQVLTQGLTEHGSRLCIVETLADFMPDAELEKSKEMRDALSRFSNDIMAYFPNTAFLLLAHFNKSTSKDGLALTRINGSTFIPAGTDAKIYLEQVSDTDHRRVLHATVRKGQRIEPTYLEFDEKTLTSTLGVRVKDEVQDKRENAKLQKLTEIDARIRQVLTETPGIPKMDVVKAVGGNRQAVSKRIDELINGYGCIEVTMGGDKGTAKLLTLLGEMPDVYVDWRTGLEQMGKQPEMEAAPRVNYWNSGEPRSERNRPISSRGPLEQITTTLPSFETDSYRSQ